MEPKNVNAVIGDGQIAMAISQIPHIKTIIPKKDTYWNKY